MEQEGSADEMGRRASSPDLQRPGAAPRTGQHSLPKRDGKKTSACNQAPRNGPMAFFYRKCLRGDKHQHPAPGQDGETPSTGQQRDCALTSEPLGSMLALRDACSLRLWALCLPFLGLGF